MKELIKVSKEKIGNESVNSVSARELHLELGLAPSQFNRWIKKNLLDNPFFEENIDFIVLRHNVDGLKQNSRGLWINTKGQIVQIEDYILTLDTAKHLAMLSRTEKAHEIRNYFIEVEKRYVNMVHPKVEDEQSREIELFKNLDNLEVFSEKLAVFQELLERALKTSKTLSGGSSEVVELIKADGFVKKATGVSPLKAFGIDFSNRFFIPTELGNMIEKSPVEINKILDFRGFQVKVDGIWKLTETGKEFGVQINGKYSQLKWKLDSII
jgi:phage anti-repressor protein